MRLVIAAALVLASLGAAPAVAQSGSSPLLKPGELLLEIDAAGVSHAPADLVMVNVPLVSTGASAAAARAANEAAGQRAVAAARSVGVDAADVKIVRQSGSRWGFVGNEAMDAALAAQAQTGPRTESSTIEIRLRDPTRFEALRTALEAAGADRVPAPDYGLANEIPARQAAKANAIARAREEAEAYARTLGMEISRVLRVSERPSANWADIEGMREMYRLMLGTSRAATDIVETQVKISVDFALVAKR